MKQSATMTERFQTEHRDLDDLFARYKAAPGSHIFAPLADACRKAGMLEEALDICTRGVRDNPRYASGYVVQGKCLYDSGRAQDARVAFDRVLELDPKNLVALKFLGILCAETGDFEHAREYFEHILVLDPDNREIRSRIEDVDVASVLSPPSGIHGSALPTPVVEAPAMPESEPVEELTDVDDESFVGEPITLRDETVTSDEIATMTLADIYASQGYTSRALKIYREVLKRQPDNHELASKIEMLKKEAAAGIEAEPAHVVTAEGEPDARIPALPAPVHEPLHETAPLSSSGPAHVVPPTGQAINQSQSYEQFKRWLKASSR